MTKRFGFDGEIGAAQGGAQIGGRGAGAAAIADGHLQPAEALLLFRVVVVGPAMADGLGGVGKSAEQRVLVFAGLGAQRPVAAAIGVAAALPALLLAEIGQGVVIAPAGQAAGLPALEIAAVAAYIGHGVGGGAAPHHLAAGAFHPAPADILLRLAEIPPVMEPLLQDLAPAQRDMDPGIPVPAAGLEDQDADIGVFGEAVGEDAAGGAGADDDMVVGLAFRHEAIPELLVQIWARANQIALPSGTNC